VDLEGLELFIFVVLYASHSPKLVAVSGLTQIWCCGAGQCGYVGGLTIKDDRESSVKKVISVETSLKTESTDGPGKQG